MILGKIGAEMLGLKNFILNYQKINGEEFWALKNVLDIESLNLNYADYKKYCDILDLIKNIKEDWDQNEVDLPQSSDSYGLTLPFYPKGMSKYVPEILGFNNFDLISEDSAKKAGNLIFTWGVTEGDYHIKSINLSLINGKQIYRLEYGFVSSFDIALKESLQHSLIISPGSMYYDAVNESAMERMLNSDDFFLSDDDLREVRATINRLVGSKITKYNHAPLVSDKLIFNENRKRILLVDQRFGDNSIAMGLASEKDFKKMLDEALCLQDVDVLIKIHPDALSGGKKSCLSTFFPEIIPDNFHIIDYEVNPYTLFEVVDEVWCCVSQMGLEALLAGKKVHTFGVSFYSGYGLTVDHKKPLRARKNRTIEELFYVYYIHFSKYFIPGYKRVSLLEMIEYFEFSRLNKVKEFFLNKKADLPSKKPKIIMIIPSSRFGATGRYFSILAFFLKKLGADVLVMCEANQDKRYSGVDWIKMEFEGIRLSEKIRNRIKSFNPNIVYVNGVRTRAQRAAIEVSLITGAKICVQSEDDDVQVYNERHPLPNSNLLKILDKKNIDIADLAKFVSLNAWDYTLDVINNPDYDRWVDPFLRACVYRMSVLNTAIWYPFEERMKQEFDVPTLVVPPVDDIDKLNKFKPSKSRVDLLRQYSLPEDVVYFYIAGTIYDYSQEYQIFLNALNLVKNKNKNVKIGLITVSGRTNLEVDSLAKEVLHPDIVYKDLGKPSDDVYMDFLVHSDVICSPGVPDDFNLYRLPSRLVKAMVLGKAILICKCGFGASLEHMKNAFIFDGVDPEVWSESIVDSLDEQVRNKVGLSAKDFAMQNFCPKKVSSRLYEAFVDIIKE